MKVRAKLLVRLAVVVSLLLPALAHAETYEVLKPCYAGVSGWQQGELEGMFMTMGGMKMLTGTMQYTKGDKTIDVVFNKGMTAAPVITEAMGTHMSMESNDISMKITKMRGLTVQLVDNKGEEKGSHLMVILEKPTEKQPGSMLVFDSETVQLDELLPFAKKFDWGCFAKKAKSVW